jgi:hypothetical protein
MTESTDSGRGAAQLDISSRRVVRRRDARSHFANGLLSGYSKKTSTILTMALFSARGIATAAPVLVLAASLLLGACADTDTGKKDDPVFFGTGGAANNGGAAKGGVSFSW